MDRTSGKDRPTFIGRSWVVGSTPHKGRVERANRTLQNRLVKELRLAGVATIEEGNASLPGFVRRYNARFARIPAQPAISTGR
jgi:hypothetical protein